MFMFFSDDEWRHDRYDRFLSLFSDVFSITAKEKLSKYRSYGLTSVLYMPWASNPKRFKPVESIHQYDVTFIGSAYGLRVEYIKYLLFKGIKIRVFGRGWEKERYLKRIWGGHVSHEEALSIICGSKINLNFLWTSQNETQIEIKGRTLELAACRSFQLTNATSELEDYGLYENEHLATFTDKKRLFEKINYYLERPEERNAIAQRAYKYVLENHTWEKRFENFTKTLMSTPHPNLPMLRVLLILDNDQDIPIPEESFRLIVVSCTRESLSLKKVDEYDAVFHIRNQNNVNFDMLYALTFFRKADESDLAISSFYIPWGNGKIWIRVRNLNLLKYNCIRKILPSEVIGYAPTPIRDYGFEAFQQEKRSITISEYPFLTISSLGFWRRRLLLMFWGNYAKNNELMKAFRKFKLLKAFNIIIDGMVQKYFVD